MSLDYNLTECALLTEEIRKEKSELIGNTIMSTMIVGIGHLKTDADVLDFQIRLEAYAMTTGNDWQSEIRLVPMLKGLRTNVFPRWTDAKFAKHLGEIAMREARARVNHARKMAESRAKQAVPESPASA